MSDFQFLAIILSTLPFVALCLLNFKAELNRTNRGRQILLPVVALVYSIAAVIFLDSIRALVEKLLSSLSQQLTFLSGINTVSLMVYILNAVFVLGFIALKGFLLPILSKIWASKNVMEFTSGTFYCYDEDTDKWFVKKELCNVRGYYKGFFYAFCIVSYIAFIVSMMYPDSVFFSAVFYPVFGILVFGEVVAFLSGFSKSEFSEDILGENEESFKVANYGILRNILKELFDERLLYESTLDASNSISETFDSLDKMSESDNPTERNTGLYFKALKESGKDIDINYVNSALYLLQGKSTLFNNPFYSDLTDYVILLLTKFLISYKKCLIIMGRDSATYDVKAWVEDGIKSITGTDRLWKTHILRTDSQGEDIDIGIIRFCDIYNLKIHCANKDFLSKVGFVMIVEPSRILSAGQIGLALLVNQCENNNKNIVYCAFDRNCDGLVDALSHVLKTDITEITATLGGSENSSQMFWRAEGQPVHHKIFPSVSHYLGMGTEINSVAMKYQLSHTEWIGSEKFPVIDMKWIAGQYYKQICGYADIPSSQESFNQIFGVNTGLWNYKQRENSFIVVEDEFQNLFEMARLFVSRAKNQCFINVISENYLLRDYMIDNADIFSADPKAIPAIVPDYARTERNSVLKLIMMMSAFPVSEDIICKEFMLCGIPFSDPYDKLKELIFKHCGISDPGIAVHFKEEFSDSTFSGNIVRYYEVNETSPLFSYAEVLKNAYYVTEDEKNEKHYIGAKLYGHVFQSFLPGQFMTFDGKYYEIQTITPLNGVVLRRAADHISNRHYYQQIRHIELSNWNDSNEIGQRKTISDLEISHGFADILVETSGYYDMLSYGDFCNAKTIYINNIPSRSYKNKSVLRIRFPNANPDILYTICLVLNEVFRTTYPDSYQYISAVTAHSDAADCTKRGYVYSLSGECEADCIYIVEDSEIDLGLTVSVERSLQRYLEIITDVLMWHTKKMLERPKTEEPEEPVPEFTLPKRKKSLWERIKDFFRRIFRRNKSAEQPIPSEDENAKPEIDSNQPSLTAADEDKAGFSPETAEPAEPATDKKEKMGFFAKIKIIFAKLFHKKSSANTDDNDNATEADSLPSEPESEDTAPEASPLEYTEIEDSAETIADSDEQSSDSALSDASDEPSDEISLMNTSFSTITDLESDEIADIQDSNYNIEGENEISVPSAPEETEYQKKCFFKFGYEIISEKLCIAEAISYLSGFGFDRNSLRQTREFSLSAEEYEHLKNPEKYGVHICDFCGKELIGGEYDVLIDGRERCNRCSMTAVKDSDDFKKLFKSVVINMEAFFGIKINAAVKVRMTDAKTIAKKSGEPFIATPEFDGRVLGFAKKDKDGYSIYVENGAPKLAAIATLVHELTHIWQYTNWNEHKLSALYGKSNMLEVYEGMAKWTEIQYLIFLNEVPYAKRQEIVTLQRDDVYGHGFAKYYAKYPLSRTPHIQKSPFKSNPPL